MRTLKLRVSGLYRPGEHVFSTGQLPLLQLVGSWLGQAGFPVGARVTVEAVEDGRLVLTRLDDAEAEPARWPACLDAPERQGEPDREAAHA